ncbi:uncharacterized protein METZ01_LOCUS37093 [marine metagenome]|uniref:Uncharacterized protein n=1 Tax=marine metagenome TaxID=408172 RepID=A0A381R045_9ZZZZ
MSTKGKELASGGLQRFAGTGVDCTAQPGTRNGARSIQAVELGYIEKVGWLDEGWIGFHGCLCGHCGRINRRGSCKLHRDPLLAPAPTLWGGVAADSVPQATINTAG